MRAIWAIQPFEKKRSQVKALLGTIQSMVGGESEIHPVSIVSPSFLNWPSDLSHDWESEFALLAHQNVSQYLKPVAKATSPITILTQFESSQKVDVLSLLEFAKEESADIVITQARQLSGLKKLWLGSFTQKLIHLSDQPILVLPAKLDSKKKIKTIFLATDFSSLSKRVFLAALPIAKRLNAKLIFSHRLMMPLEPVVDASLALAGGGWLSVEQVMVADREDKRKNADQWKKLAQEAGVKSEYVEDKSTRALSDGLLKTAQQKKADLIVIGTEISVMGAQLVGSVAQEVIASSKVPVLVVPLHEKIEKPKKNKK